MHISSLFPTHQKVDIQKSFYYFDYKEISAYQEPRFARFYTKLQNPKRRGKMRRRGKVIFSASAIEKRLKPMDFSSISSSSKGKIIADWKAVKKYLLEKKELEEKHFPKVKITFP